jgi:hypothetical protein
MNFGKSFGKSFDQMCPMLYRWTMISESKYNKRDWYKNLVIVGAADINPCNKYKDITITSIKRPLDARGYNAGITFNKHIYNVKISEVFLLDVILRNKSNVLWPAEEEKSGKYGIFLSYRWLNADKTPMTGYDARFSLLYDIKVGHTRLLPVEILAPIKKGTCFSEFDLVQESVAWFRDKGSKTSLVKIIVK